VHVKVTFSVPMVITKAVVPIEKFTVPPPETNFMSGTLNVVVRSSAFPVTEFCWMGPILIETGDPATEPCAVSEALMTGVTCPGSTSPKLMSPVLIPRSRSEPGVVTEHFCDANGKLSPAVTVCGAVAVILNAR
jgi:hypothetical protein